MKKPKPRPRRFPKKPTAIDPARLAAEMLFHMPTKRPEPAPAPRLPTHPRGLIMTTQTAQSSDLAERIASAAMQAVRKHHATTGTIPSRARTAAFRVRFEDGRFASYTVTLKHVSGAA